MFTYFNSDFPVNSEFTWLVYRCLPDISTETLGHVAFFTPTGHLDGELAALKRPWICGTPRGAGLIPLIWKLPILGSAGIQGVLWYPGIPLKANNYPAELSDSLSSEMSEMKPVGNDSPDPNHHRSIKFILKSRPQIRGLPEKNCWPCLTHRQEANDCSWPSTARPETLSQWRSWVPNQSNAEMEGGSLKTPKNLKDIEGPKRLQSAR